MFAKIIFVAALAVVCASAKPGLVAPLAYSAPLLAPAPAIVTAQSSQYIARNYNGVAPLAYTAAYTAAGPIAYAAAPALAAAAYTSPLAAAPVLL
ncbi:cuticle protein 16.5-like [Toxorhynchites rutilus septentrionalis]|uniref:cuticle protein 16.5-like n=1 Tax=Toxorhynchites rutilus septentrionalis TaxID=329112 RepID=UPI0024793BCF|nr:cuticle protein 16.5-like [Toxorhynchites rutilus septentrionalis]